MDILSHKLGMDPLELRLRNVILPGDTSATQTLLNRSNLGNLPKYIQKLTELIHWGEVDEAETKDGKVRAKGVNCFWKNSNTSLNAGEGAVLTFNSDGSIKEIFIHQGKPLVVFVVVFLKYKIVNLI